MRILNRYLVKEMFTPTLLGFVFYTFIILMRSLFEFAQLIIGRSLPFGTVMMLLGLSLPHIVVLTIPMALIFGILIAIGRLSSDSEIIAMKAVGISTTAIYKPVFYFSFAVFLINLYVMNVVLPRGNVALQALKAEIFTSSIEKNVTPHVFFDQFTNWMIYVNDVDPKLGTWKGVLLADTTDPANQKIIIADTGHLSIVGPSKQVWADLTNAQTHVFSPKKPERYDLDNNRTQRFLLTDAYADSDKGKPSHSFREMSVPELLEQAQLARHDHRRYDYRQAWKEIHKKFSIPFACIAFGLVGLPLGITNRRGGKSSGFSISLALIVVYWILINRGEEFVNSGKMTPLVGMWLPNVILIAFGIYLLRRANSDSGMRQGRSVKARIEGLWTRLAHSRRARVEAPRAVEGEQPSILSRLDISFPNILDRYILREYLKMLLLVLVSVVALFIIIDYTTEVAADAAEHKIAFSVVAAYYRGYTLQIVNLTLPISLLLATLITFGIMAKNNEVTAIKANGVSLYRIALPILAIGAMFSVFSYFLQDFVLPYSNQRVDELKAKIKGKETPQAFGLNQRQWLFGKGRYVFNYLSYDDRAKALSQVQVLEFAPNKLQLTRRVWAEEARFDGVGWVFVNGWIRSFSDDGTSSYTPIINPVRLWYPERPSYFERVVKTPPQMTYAELRKYIGKLKASGYAANDLTVKLYEKTSWPFISLVMTLIALPFSFKMGKKGTMYGIAVALLLAFVYWILFGVFTKFGEVGNLPAILSAWSANILFGLAAVYLFLRVET